ncbi:MAG: glycosyltransferase family 39 protein, partial [Planctomycetota bacterium]
MSRRDVVFVLLCTALALAVRLPLLGRPVWFDEACMSSQRIGTWEQLVATLYVDIHPPLFVTFMHCWGRLFGDGELALRLPALLSGLAALPLLFWSGYRLVGVAAARWAVLLLALSPAHAWYSAEARLYAPMVAWTLLVFGTAERLLAGDSAHRRRLQWLHVAGVGVLLALHYYLAVFVVALAIAAPFVARGLPRPVRWLLVVHGVALVLLAAFVAAKLALGEFETSQDYLGPLTADKLRAFVLDWCWSGHALLPADGDGQVVAGT